MADRVDVLKTYKTYVGGAFPRSESGRTYKVYGKNDQLLANACRCSRKDIRDAVEASRAAFSGWKSLSAHHRGQILYRISEMLEGRKEQFVEELIKSGISKKQSRMEVDAAIDRFIYFAGWTDKYAQIYGSINPVASDHFNFSYPEPIGILAVIPPETSRLIGPVSMIAPAIAGGNTLVMLASQTHPLAAITLGEVLHVSDLPAGVVNILSGYRDELIPVLTSHMDVNAIWNSVEKQEVMKQIDENAALNIKRVVHTEQDDWLDPRHENPYSIVQFQEIKTTWHPSGY